jgi:hypothetical protein
LQKSEIFPSGYQTTIFQRDASLDDLERSKNRLRQNVDLLKPFNLICAVQPCSQKYFA